MVCMNTEASGLGETQNSPLQEEGKEAADASSTPLSGGLPFPSFAGLLHLFSDFIMKWRIQVAADSHLDRHRFGAQGSELSNRSPHGCPRPSGSKTRRLWPAHAQFTPTGRIGAVVFVHSVSQSQEMRVHGRMYECWKISNS